MRCVAPALVYWVRGATQPERSRVLKVGQRSPLLPFTLSTWAGSSWCVSRRRGRQCARWRRRGGPWPRPPPARAV